MLLWIALSLISYFIHPLHIQNQANLDHPHSGKSLSKLMPDHLTAFVFSVDTPDAEEQVFELDDTDDDDDDSSHSASHFKKQTFADATPSNGKFRILLKKSGQPLYILFHSLKIPFVA
jgi:hypothetical protein